MENTTIMPTPLEEVNICKELLYQEIAPTAIRLWDLIILLPNLCFCIYLCITYAKAYAKLSLVSSPIFTTFYVMIWVDVVTSVLRCVVAMSVDSLSPVGVVVEKILWVFVRFVLLSTEICVIVLSLAFGHLDSKKCIFYVLSVTSVFSLAFSGIQGYLEIASPDESFHVNRTDREYDLFGHGGMVFWFTTSVIIAVVYLIVFILPWTPMRNRLALPTRASFYNYILALAMLYLMSSIGSGLLLGNLTTSGLCIVDGTTYLYFTILTPVVYVTFLAGFFSSQEGLPAITYKTQIDDLEDSVSLPHHSSVSSVKTDYSDNIFQTASIYDSSSFVSIDSIDVSAPLRTSTSSVAFSGSLKPSETAKSDFV